MSHESTPEYESTPENAEPEQPEQPDREEVHEERERRIRSEDKSWPPSGMEAKVPGVSGAK